MVGNSTLSTTRSDDIAEILLTWRYAPSFTHSLARSVKTLKGQIISKYLVASKLKRLKRIVQIG